jgi:hypothetical protein
MSNAALNQVVEDLKRNERESNRVVYSAAEEIEIALRQLRDQLPKNALSEGVRLHGLIGRGANECVALVQEQLTPASTTPKRKDATARLVAALGAIQLANQELFAALSDVEDAV